MFSVYGFLPEFLQTPRESGFTHGFLLLALTSAATVGVALLVPSARRTPVPTPTPPAEPLTAPLSR